MFFVGSLVGVTSHTTPLPTGEGLGEGPTVVVCWPAVVVLRLLPHLIPCKPIIEDKEEAGDADPIGGLIGESVLYESLQPWHDGTTSNGHGQ